MRRPGYEVVGLTGRRPDGAGPQNTANLWVSYVLKKGTIKGFGIGAGGVAGTDVLGLVMEIRDHLDERHIVHQDDVGLVNVPVRMCDRKARNSICPSCRA